MQTDDFSANLCENLADEIYSETMKTFKSEVFFYYDYKINIVETIDL